jgi:glyoxylase-like metal-dependent hydrolase (beta-lactamase superfamily II)
MTGDLAFIPLGGTGEIGLNLNVYRCDGQLLAVDCGIGFGGPEHPEVEVMVPDPGWLVARRDRLVGLVITHAHEDHVGAVAHLWPQLRCPIHAGPFGCAASWSRPGCSARRRSSRIRSAAVSPWRPSTWNGCASRIPYRRRRRWRSARNMAPCCIPATGSSTRSR